MEDAAGGEAGLDLGAVARRPGLAASTVRAWDQVMAPELTWIGRKHAASGRYVEVEHLLSAVLVALPGHGVAARGG
ncbi:hypothetical protein [Spirillospora sp. CA-128828]|uniref:hypothetical protein n=1 Tax=Spirillospora sp. CA-128828 TaxID=3240033 RepID=UPI003D8BF92D